MNSTHKCELKNDVAGDISKIFFSHCNNENLDILSNFFLIFKL